MWKKLPFLWSWPDYIPDDPDYRKAVEFEETFTPHSDRDYDWVWTYASENFGRLETMYKDLDSKADSIIRYLGGGTGLVTLGAIATISKETAPIVLWMVPSVLIALAAIVFAARARVPVKTPFPPSVEGAVKYVNAFDQQAKDTFLGQWHLTCEAMRLAIREKAWGVKWATRLFTLALTTLLLPFISAAWAVLA